MHLKNFSLYSPQQEVYTLTPAYDMLSTALVMPEDTEELALTLNGKKRKLKKADFVTSIRASGLDEKVIENLFKKLLKVETKWMEFISLSFLPEEMQISYKDMIRHKTQYAEMIRNPTRISSFYRPSLFYFNPPSEERVIQFIPLITYHISLLSKSLQATESCTWRINTDSL